LIAGRYCVSVWGSLASTAPRRGESGVRLADLAGRNRPRVRWRNASRDTLPKRTFPKRTATGCRPPGHTSGDFYFMLVPTKQEFAKFSIPVCMRALTLWGNTDSSAAISVPLLVARPRLRPERIHNRVRFPRNQTPHHNLVWQQMLDSRCLARLLLALNKT
jgi:hypothetical protein